MPKSCAMSCPLILLSKQTDFMKHYPNRSLVAVSVAALLAMAGCASHSDIQPSLSALDARQLGLDGTQAFDVSEQVAPWWQSYGDVQLSRLIEQALVGSPTIAVAQTRLQRVQAQELSTRGADQPTLQASTEVDRQLFTEHGLYPTPLAGTIRNTGTVQLASSWEFDLFGKQHAEVEASIGQTKAAVADMHAARLLLSSQVARSYVQLGRLQAQREVLQRTLTQRDEMLSLTRQRVQAGLDTQVELKQGEGFLPDTRLQIESLDEQISLARHALAVLTGQAPQALDQLDVKIDQLKPQAAPEAVPMDLLARRADVMAARWRAEASGHQVDAARAMFYPNINLTSYVGYNAIGLNRLLDPGSFQWGLMPAIHLPLFDGDRRRANLQGQVAERDASVANYNQTVLQAMQEVVDQLSSGQSIVRQQREQAAVQQSTEAAYALALQRYKAGLGSYLTVLSAESGVLAQRRMAVDLKARTLDSQMTLFRALGGSLQAAGPVPTQAHTPVSQDQLQTAKQTGDRS